MSEIKAIVGSAAQLRRAGKPFLVATVVRVKGSSYRRPGARMLLGEEQWIAGSVSGGCLEGDVIKKGWWRTRAGAPVLVTYDQTAPDEIRAGLGLGCDGVVDVLLERFLPGDSGDPLLFMQRCLAAQRRGAVGTVFESNTPDAPAGARVRVGIDDDAGVTSITDEVLRARIVRDCGRALASGRPKVCSYETANAKIEVLVEAVLPPVRLFILGTGHDAVPVVQLARTVGWDVLVCDTHARFTTRERFAMADEIVVGALPEIAARVNASDRAMAVIMGHDYERDRDVLGMLAATRVKYIGVLGPRRRTEKLCADLAGRVALDDPRIHAPVGLELGAETPQEIALSVIAEIQSALTRAKAASLRQLAGAIHAGSP